LNVIFYCDRFIIITPHDEAISRSCMFVTGGFMRRPRTLVFCANARGYSTGIIDVDEAKLLDTGLRSPSEDLTNLFPRAAARTSGAIA
jgi:hypothetical protein